MYIRTPKRYRGMQRRSLFSCQRFLLIFVLVVLIVIGVGIYQMRDMFAPQMIAAVEGGLDQVAEWQATQFAPTPPPTEDPSRVLIDAGNEYDAGRVSLSLNRYEQIIDQVPNDVQVHTRMTESYLTRGNIRDALTYAERTVTANPFNADAWATRALVYSWEEDFAEGIASAQQALALDPDNVRATAYLGYAYFQAGLSTLASNRAQEAIDLNPDHWSGYWVRGLVAENVFPIDLNAAQSDYDRAYNLARQQNPAMVGVAGAGLARVISSLGNPNGAVQLLNDILTFDDTNREVLYYLGITHYSALGEWGQAQDPFTDCVEVAPEDVSCWYMLGRTRYSLDDQEGALDAFAQAVELDTPFARHYWWAGRAERVLGSCAAAAPYLETGYDMVREGGRPAVEEGDATLLEAFEDELATCRITFVPAVPEATTAPEPDPTAEGDS